MSDNTVILCPGQGAQRVGMGKAWFDASSAAAQTFAAADEILGDRLGAPLSRLCFEGPEDQVNKTNVSQPAIFVTSVACRQAMLESESPLATHIAGLSLGEYTALHLAGVMSFEDALELVALRGAAMQDAAEASAESSVLSAEISSDTSSATKSQGGNISIQVPISWPSYSAPTIAA